MYKDTPEGYKKQRADFEALGIEEGEFTLSGLGEDTDSLITACLGTNFVNALSSQYDGLFEDYPLDADNKFVRYLSRWQPGSRVLHLGCGTGREVLVGKSMGLKSVGVTLGRRNVEFGRQVLGLSDEEILLSPCELLPYKPETFDAVLGCQIFEHTVSPLMFLLEQGRVLKPGGELVLEWPAASFHATNGADPHHQVCYTPGQAWGLLLKAGFKDIELFYNDMSPIPQAYWWQGEQHRGYVIAIAKKAESDVGYVVRSRGLYMSKEYEFSMDGGGRRSCTWPDFLQKVGLTLAYSRAGFSVLDPETGRKHSVQGSTFFYKYLSQALRVFSGDEYSAIFQYGFTKAAFEDGWEFSIADGIAALPPPHMYQKEHEEIFEEVLRLMERSVV